MERKLVDPVETYRYLLTRLLRITAEMSEEEREDYFCRSQINPILIALVREEVESDKLTAETIHDVSVYGGTDHNDPFFT